VLNKLLRKIKIKEREKEDKRIKTYVW